MKVCVIGNSHIGALIRAWNSGVNNLFKGVEITFFGCVASGLAGLSLDGKKLVADSAELKAVLSYISNGEDSIDLTQYDVFLVYALDAKPYFVSSGYYSKAVIERSVKDVTKLTLSLKIVKLVREAVSSRIYVAHNPMEAIRNKNIQERASASKLASYCEGIQCLNERFYSLINAELVPQPQETVASTGRATLTKYSEGSKRLDWKAEHEKTDRVHPDDDIGHMNDCFGAIWLETFLRKLSAEQG